MTNYRPRLIHWIIAAGLILLTALPVKATGQEQVTICHAAGLDGTTQYVEITVGYPAAYGPGGHFNEDGTTQAGHEEDYLGPCQTDSTPSPTSNPSVEPSVSASPTPSQEPTPSSSPSPTLSPSPSQGTSLGSPTPTRTTTAVPSIPDTSVQQEGVDLGSIFLVLGGILMGIGGTLLATRYLTARR